MQDVPIVIPAQAITYVMAAHANTFVIAAQAVIQSRDALEISDIEPGLSDSLGPGFRRDDAAFGIPAQAITFVIPAQAITFVIPAQAITFVIPAQAGIQCLTAWVPAFAGTARSRQRRPRSNVGSIPDVKRSLS
jgi:hypothetical protein